MGVNVAQIFMPESVWCCSDYLKPIFFPEPYSTFVCAYNHIELHGLIAAFGRKPYGVFAKLFPHTFSLSIWMDHITAICNMVTQINLVGLYDICSQYLFVFLYHEGCHIVGKPMFF